jgi:hypothetical protein
MLAALALVLAALRQGLRLRRARTARRTPPAGARAAHLRLAKPAVACIALGLLAGPASAVWLRGWDPLGTFHGAVGVIAAGLFAATAVHGRRLERGRGAARGAHAAFAALAVLAAGMAAIAGFVLLP